MVDVTVDMKPMAKLPYDPEVIPPAVRERVKAVEEFYKANSESGGEQRPPDTPESPVQPVPAEVAPVTPQVPSPETPPLPAAAAPAEPSPAPDEGSAEDWKRKFFRMQGRFNAAEKTIGEMQIQMQQLGDELLRTTQHLQRRAPQNARPAPQRAPAPSYVTDEDVQNYGGDLIAFTQRAAAEVALPEIQEVKKQNADLQRQLAKESRHRLDQAVELAVPNFREIDRDPRWHRWLLGIDLLSGRVRQTLLNEAISAASAPRVISFFKGFLQEEVATGHVETAPASSQPAAPREPVIPLASIASPGRLRPAGGGETSLPAEKPTYTRVQIRDNYRNHQKGVYVGREAEWNALERDMIAAGREGRVR